MREPSLILEEGQSRGELYMTGSEQVNEITGKFLPEADQYPMSQLLYCLLGGPHFLSMSSCRHSQDDTAKDHGLLRQELSSGMKLETLGGSEICPGQGLNPHKHEGLLPEQGSWQGIFRMLLWHSRCAFDIPPLPSIV